ncbi:LAME_0G00606g1_1 [Lachancea meyersii CBS 8951]|uniref:Spindle pole body component KRE28 n=1 Tax=Lachancea meyersii CBS 8951 TaxID=1266667 RepID=A0A1G4K4T6_9SACH|nr:LAME_0G00606g1_1 [Lachancea meyersii CBS 8951]
MEDGRVTKGLASRLGTVEEETTNLSEQVLQDQETHYCETVEQLKRSTQQLVEDNEFLFEAVPQGAEIDPKNISSHIADLSQFMDRLKNTHLEQEMLDNFLRYTIPSGDISQQISSSQDEIYVSLEKDVQHLRDEVITELDSEVEQLRAEIGETSQKIADQREVVNELCLNTGELVDECRVLLEELEKSGDLNVAESEKAGNHNDVSDAASPGATIQQLQSIKEKIQEKRHLEQQMGHLESTKTSLGAILSSSSEQDEKRSVKSYKAYQALIEYWQSEFINQDIRNLEIFPKSNRCQFTYHNVEVVVSLGDMGISKIDLYGSSIPPENLETARRHANKKYFHETPLHIQFNNVLNIIKENATSV